MHNCHYFSVLLISFSKRIRKKGNDSMILIITLPFFLARGPSASDLDDFHRQMTFILRLFFFPLSFLIILLFTLKFLSFCSYSNLPIVPNTVFVKERCLTTMCFLEWMVNDIKSIPHCTKQCRYLQIFKKIVKCYLPGPYLVQITTGAVSVIRISQNMSK